MAACTFVCKRRYDHAQRDSGEVTQFAAFLPDSSHWPTSENAIVGWLPIVLKCSPPPLIIVGRMLVWWCLQACSAPSCGLLWSFIPAYNVAFCLSMPILQQVWSYLEPLFIHSEEVKKELPLDTKRFEKIDREVKAMLTELWTVKKVRTLCNPSTNLAVLE